MDFSKLVLERRTVHNYRSSDAVPASLVDEALALSLWAVNHRLTFPWVYVLVGPEARAKIADLAVELKTAKETLSEIKIKATRETILNPSFYIALGIKLCGYSKQEHEDYATLAASVQIASLHLWKHGVGSKWSTGLATTHSRTYEILGLNPSEVRLEGALFVGHPLAVPEAPSRPQLSDILRRTT